MSSEGQPEVEAFAALMVKLDRSRDPGSRAKILSEAKLDEPGVARMVRDWKLRFRREGVSSYKAYRRAYADARRELFPESTALGVGQSAQSGAASAAPFVPSYLLARSQPDATKQAPPATAPALAEAVPDPDLTAAAGIAALALPVMPFQRPAAEGPDVAVTEPATAMLETAALPDPAELAKLIARANPFAATMNPDETSVAAVRVEEILPFLSQRQREAPATHAGSGDADVDPGETAMIPSPLLADPDAKEWRDKLTPAAVPELSVKAYAEVQAECRVLGDRAEAWQRVGVFGDDAKRQLQARFFERFRSDATAQEEFQREFRSAIERFERAPRR